MFASRLNARQPLRGWTSLDARRRSPAFGGIHARFSLQRQTSSKHHYSHILLNIFT